MGYLTRIDGVPDRDDLRPGMAHFCGTGPAGKTCGDCKHRGYYREGKKGKWSEKLQTIVFKTRKVLGCAMYYKMTQEHGAPVKKDYPACKYYE